MKASTLSLLQSPDDDSPLFVPIKSRHGEIASGQLEGKSRSYPIQEGIPYLIAPSELAPSDLEFQQKYNAGVSDYQTGMDWLFKVFNETEHDCRRQMADILDSQNQDLVLDLGCGTGEDARHILSKNPKCSVILADISVGMVKEAKVRLKGFEDRTDFVLCNASHLPFRNEIFDRVFHFGGINEFGNKEKAINEFCRVTKPGGKIVFGDEGVAPWLAEKEYGAILKTANPLYNHQPPLALLPPEARNVKTHWLLGNAFYLIEFGKGEGFPPIDLDLPIPGKRGGSLRSRFKSGSSNGL